MKKLLLKCLLLLPIPLLMIAVNYFSDPAHLFARAGYDGEIAGLLAQGQNVANVSDGDERVVQLETIRLGGGHALVVLGSSRTLGMDAALFPGRTFFNHSVTGATLEDQVGLYQALYENGQLPEVVILGLDAWLLNRNHGQIRWVSLADEYLRGMGQMGQMGLDDGLDTPELRRQVWLAELEMSWERGTELISPTYLRRSALTLLRQVRTGQSDRPYATELTSGGMPIKLGDGSYVYERAYRERTAEQAEQAAREYVSGGSVYSLEDFTALDPEYMQWLEAFVERMQADGVMVVFFLSPYHPTAYEALAGSEEYRIIREAESYFRALADEKQVTLLGSYDPAAAGCAAAEFYDGMHARYSCVESILAPLR